VHVVIMGCGRVGSSLAHSLEARDHDTSVIDSDPEAFRRLGPGFTGTTVRGYGFDRDVLLEAGIERADAFAAVSSGDNSNIISARVARENFGVENVVARIYDPGRADVYERLGIPTVAVVPWAADKVLRRILPAGAEPTWRDPTGALRLDTVYSTPAWNGRTIGDLEASGLMRVTHVTRLGIGRLARPDLVIESGDFMSLMMREEDAEAAHRLLDKGEVA
jgi:trk system potassium uptake protein TrkA